MLTHRLSRPRPLGLALLASCLAAVLCQSALADAPTGEQIYKKQCATCHGASGQGTKQYKDPLAGDKSVPQLAKLIAKTMPENDPGSLSAEDAQRVAAYIHDTFYSVAARERNKPPRIELARLTVRQYRNAVADLVGSFRPAVKGDEQRGLKAEYYKGRRLRGGERVLERIDPEVRFDFGTDSPVPDKTEAHEFSIRWNGSLLAPETGHYEFLVRTEHAARLWVNELNRPLIDAWVKSGNDTEYRGSIFLVGGRAYSLRLEYSKAKQGVDDSKKNPAKPPPVQSSIALEWKLPHRTSTTIPARNLSPATAAESFAVATPFPPDDRSYGWERGTTVSKEWDQATTEAALEAAGYIAAHVDELAGLRSANREPGPGSGNPSEINLDRPAEPKPSPERDAKIKEFCRKFAERAFRRPLSDEQKKLFVDRQFEATKDVTLSVKRVVLLVLKSPRFLYREADAGSDSYAVAARLSFGLWDSLPDAELLAAAAAGQLTTREQVAKQAERMLSDPRSRAKLREFLLTWLKVDHAPDGAKDPKRYPGFDAAIVTDLRTSLELFLDETVWSDRSDFRQLLLADHLHLNDRLAKYYGAEPPAGPGFDKVKLNPEHRAGVLTHPYLMTAFSYTGETSPIHRGVFLARGVLGVSLRPPPEAFTPLPAELHPKLTTRERVALQTKPKDCMSCHGVINPLGFTLEQFDAVGRYREKDNDKKVDAVGSYETRNGKTVKFTGARELGKFLAGSEEVQEAFVEQLFHHLVQQPIRAYGPTALRDLRGSFAAKGYNIRKLVVEEMTTAALQNQKQASKPTVNPAAAYYGAAYSPINSVNRANAGAPPWNRKLIP